MHVCEHPFVYHNTWNMYTDFSTAPPANCNHGELRLAGGQLDDMEGRVEICISNAWGTICDTGFNSEAAQVICRQLGHPSGGKKNV